MHVNITMTGFQHLRVCGYYVLLTITIEIQEWVYIETHQEQRIPNTTRKKTRTRIIKSLTTEETLL